MHIYFDLLIGIIRDLVLHVKCIEINANIRFNPRLTNPALVCSLVVIVPSFILDFASHHLHLLIVLIANLLRRLSQAEAVANSHRIDALNLPRHMLGTKILVFLLHHMQKAKAVDSTTVTLEMKSVEGIV
jgi:hypothetical protein